MSTIVQLVIACLRGYATGLLLSILWAVAYAQNQPPSGRYERGPEKDRVIVFVHGVHGSPSDTWTASNGTYWPSLLKTDAVFNDSDIYVAGYSTPYTGNLATPPDVAESLHQFLETDGVFKRHREVVFVCHSLGGLVVEQMLLLHPGDSSKISFIAFYSTPHAGAVIANFVSVFSNDPLVKAMVDGGGNNYLTALERDWRGAGFRVPRFCAFEEKKMTPATLWGLRAPKVLLDFVGGLLVVDPISATYGCDDTSIPVGIPEDHMGVVKPDGLRHLAHVVLRNLQQGRPKSVIGPVRARFDEPICAFYGESNSGEAAWHKTETCVIKNSAYLDVGYHQGGFVCCGGGATSNMTLDKIPPGLEIQTDGGYYWAVLSGRRDGDKYSLDTYCGPASAAGPGCNVKVKIIGHYKLPGVE